MGNGDRNPMTGGTESAIFMAYQTFSACRRFRGVYEYPALRVDFTCQIQPLVAVFAVARLEILAVLVRIQCGVQTVRGPPCHDIVII